MLNTNTIKNKKIYKEDFVAYVYTIHKSLGYMTIVWNLIVIESLVCSVKNIILLLLILFHCGFSILKK